MRVPRILLNLYALARFPGSSRYWEWRYRSGGNSGAGSYGAEAAYKADYINDCIAKFAVQTVIDFGCGDGNQLRELRIPAYTGYDVSAAAVKRCRELFEGDSSKKFHTLDRYANEVADATLSLDVLYHLVEDEVFDGYVRRLFDASGKIVIIYAIDQEEKRMLRGRHVHHRKFTSWIARHYPSFELIEAPVRPGHLASPPDGAASFFVFRRRMPSPG